MNQASQVLHKVDEIPMLYKRLFGAEIDIWDAIELLPIILRQTGSIAFRSYLFRGTIVDYELQLPANLYAIKHVCSSLPLSFYSPYITSMSEYLLNYRVDQTGNIGAYNPDVSDSEELDDSSVTNVYTVNQNVFSAPLGSMIDFVNQDNHCLNFNWKDKDVDVLYSGSVVDENGYFMLPEKTLEAVCYYLFFIEIRKRFYMKTADINMLKQAEKDKDQKVAQARTPSALSQNEQDMILNVFTSMNKKRHNRQKRV